MDNVAFNQAIKRLEKQDLERLIRSTFDKIPANEALVLQLFYIDDQRIAEIQANGFKALILSVILIAVLGILFSIPNSTPFIGYSLFVYSSTSLALLTLFVQLEVGKRKIFNHL